MTADETRQQINRQYKLLIEARDRQDSKAVRRLEESIARLRADLAKAETA